MTFSLLVAALAPPAAGPVTGDDFDRWMDAVTPATVVVGDNDGAMPLEALMASRAVPGVQVVLIDEGRIVARRSYGLADVAGARAVTDDTRFQAASISKPVAAMTMLSMVDDGLLALDAPVNDALVRWKLPDGGYDEEVTLRRLLSHTAGTSVSGFPGYGAGERVPSLPELLDGKGNTDPVRVTSRPGSEHRYSGGGFTIAELAAEDAARTPFEYLAYDHVIAPFGMTHSSYAPGAAMRAPVAFAYSGDGSAIAGGFHTYPEQAAAGLWTTAEDLAAFAVGLARIAGGEEGGPITPATARTMLDAVMSDYGLGIGTWEDSGHRYFGHGGSNAGYKAMLRYRPDTGEGIAVMTNGDRGSSVIEAMMTTVAEHMGWDGLAPRRLDRATLDAAALAGVAGTYEFNGDRYVLRVDGDRWRLTNPDGQTEPALPITEDRLYFPEAEQLFDIARAADGSVEAIVMGGARLPRVAGPDGN